MGISLGGPLFWLLCVFPSSFFSNSLHLSRSSSGTPASAHSKICLCNYGWCITLATGPRPLTVDMRLSSISSCSEGGLSTNTIVYTPLACLPDLQICPHPPLLCSPKTVELRSQSHCLPMNLFRRAELVGIRHDFHILMCPSHLYGKYSSHASLTTSHEFQQCLRDFVKHLYIWGKLRKLWLCLPEGLAASQPAELGSSWKLAVLKLCSIRYNLERVRWGLLSYVNVGPGLGRQPQTQPAMSFPLIAFVLAFTNSRLFIFKY